MRTLEILVAAAVAAAACGHPAATPAAVVPATSPHVVAAAPDPTPTPELGVTVGAALNLGFEDVDGDQGRGWSHGIGVGTQGSAGYEIGVVDQSHSGSHALRMHGDRGGGFGSVARSLDADAVRGKRLRLHGWIQTEGVTAPGWAGLWIRIDDGARGFDNMQRDGLVGTEGWREGVADVEVPENAGIITIGALVVGSGTAWFDDLQLEVVETVPPHPIVLEGTVTDGGTPVAGAVVSLNDPLAGVTTAVARTDAGGRFHFDATSGRWGFAAHAAVGAASVDSARFDDDARDLALALAPGEVTVHGKLSGASLPPDVYVQISPTSPHDSDLFAVPVGADGTFSARLPAGKRYLVVAKQERLRGEAWAERQGDDAEVELSVTALAPPPDEVVGWLRDHAIRLTSAEAGHGFDDLGGVGKIVGKARVVALGEATHGTREFFQLKHRILEYLVATKGFTLFGIEANQPECRAINDYVLHGVGDARAALRGIYFWTWNTEEVLAMIEWMRTWNDDPSHQQKVQFVGFDMQTTTVAYASVAAYLREVAPTEADALLAPIVALAGQDASQQVAGATPEARVAIDAGLKALEARFATRAKRWRKATSKQALADARHDLTILRQAFGMYGVKSGGFDARDRAMADNIEWLLAQHPGERMVVWAHNGHVGMELGGVHNMGGHLRKELGAKDYRIFGFGFGDGSFQARDQSGEHGGELGEITLGPAPEWDLSAPFTRAGLDLAVVDLRTLKAGVVRDWFAAPHPMRDTGAVFVTEEAMSELATVTDLFDAR
ncbi:MAG: erythromycin esterase family protein [Kofleriaceae bacterium]|nr:erythromycin esterase family protein [Kofleriaceae bacterium]